METIIEISLDAFRKEEAKIAKNFKSGSPFYELFKKWLSAKTFLLNVSFAVCVSRVLHTTRNGGHENQGRANYCIFNVSPS